MAHLTHANSSLLQNIFKKLGPAATHVYSKCYYSVGQDITVVSSDFVSI